MFALVYKDGRRGEGGEGREREGGRGEEEGEEEEE